MEEDRPVRIAVVGHTEWIHCLRVERVPLAGEIIHATETWEEAGGGGAIAAVQMARLAGAATFYAALGHDEIGRRSAARLRELGLRVEAVTRPVPQRRGFAFIDRDGERTITVWSRRMGPSGDDPLPWHELEGADAVFVTAGDATALRHARAARVVVATSRILDALAESGIEVDVIVRSGRDENEPYVEGLLDPPPRVVVATRGAEGGVYRTADGREGSWAAAPLPGPSGDAFGAGDSFAGGLTYGLGAGMGLGEALGLAARCGAASRSGRGPYGGQLVLADPTATGA